MLLNNYNRKLKDLTNSLRVADLPLWNKVYLTSRKLI